MRERHTAASADGSAAESAQNGRISSPSAGASYPAHDAFRASVLLLGRHRGAAVRLRLRLEERNPAMKMTWRGLGLAALLAGVASPAAAQMTPIAALNCTDANFPNCGWGYWGNNPHYTLTRVGTGGPFHAHARLRVEPDAVLHGLGHQHPAGPDRPVPLHPAAAAHHLPGESVRRRRHLERQVHHPRRRRRQQLACHRGVAVEHAGQRARDAHPEEHRGRRSADAAAAAAHRPAARAAVRGAERQFRPRRHLAEQRQLSTRRPAPRRTSTCRPTPGTTSASATTRTPRSRPAAASRSR